VSAEREERCAELVRSVGDELPARVLEAGAVNQNNVMMSTFQLTVPMSGWKESGVGSRSGGAAGTSTGASGTGASSSGASATTGATATGTGGASTTGKGGVGGGGAAAGSGGGTTGTGTTGTGTTGASTNGASSSGTGTFQNIASTSTGGASSSTGGASSSTGGAKTGSTSTGGESSTSSTSTSSSFIELVDMHGYQVVVPLSESEIGNVNVGQIATVTVEALEGRKFAARVVSRNRRR